MNEGVRCEGWGEKLLTPVPATRMGESQRQSGALFPFLHTTSLEHQANLKNKAAEKYTESQKNPLCSSNISSSGWNDQWGDIYPPPTPGLFIQQRPSRPSSSFRHYRRLPISLLSTVADIFIHIPFTLKAKTHFFPPPHLFTLAMPATESYSVCPYLLVDDKLEAAYIASGGYIAGG
ncbi:hypothetical protein CDAR_43231 [Caerostris darwini]|uniref:Uncharacterized protein n=1 Tax=Caerostris darwini TaxID=1538125 RepID=A0AAV4WGA5_9ARAC|nr:hypothetical protein CDAR_43231 [Caerostris darwini]